MFLSKVRCFYRVKHGSYRIFRATAVTNEPRWVPNRVYSDNVTGGIEDIKCEPIGEKPKLGCIRISNLTLEELLQAIHAAKNTKEILDQLDEVNLREDAILPIFRILYKCQQIESSSLPIDQLSSHPKFQNLCSKLKDIRHQLTEADLIDLLNFTHSLGLPNHEKKMYIMLLKLVNHCQLKDLDPNRIRDLYLMTRSNKKYHSLSATARNMRTAASKILGKFKSALAERTDNPQKLESDVYENFEFPQTMESEIIMDTIKAVIANLEKRQNHEMTPTEAYNLVIGCGSLDKFPFEHRDLWEKALHVVIEHLYSTDVQDSDNVIAVVTKLYLKYPKLRCNLFLQLIADRAMQGIIQTPLNSFQLMDQFDKLNFCSLSLLRSMSTRTVQYKLRWHNVRSSELVPFVKCCARAYYRPTNLDEMFSTKYLKRSVFAQALENHSEWSWLEVGVSLAVLDSFDQAVLEQVINKAILQMYARRNMDAEQYLNVLRLYQHHYCKPSPKKLKIDSERFITLAIQIIANIEFSQLPLKDELENRFGKEYVVSKVISPYGHCIQHLMIRNTHTMEFVPFNRDRWMDDIGENPDYLQLNNVSHMKNEQLVAINHTSDICYTDKGSPELSGHCKMFRRQLEFLGLEIHQHSPTLGSTISDNLQQRQLPLQWVV